MLVIMYLLQKPISTTRATRQPAHSLPFTCVRDSLGRLRLLFLCDFLRRVVERFVEAAAAVAGVAGVEREEELEALGRLRPPVRERRVLVDAEFCTRLRISSSIDGGGSAMTWCVNASWALMRLVRVGSRCLACCYGRERGRERGNERIEGGRLCGRTIFRSL